MSLKKSVIGAVAVLSTVALAGCGSASDISSSQGASLTRQNFASAVTAATTHAGSVHISGTISAQGQKMTLSGDESMSGASIKDVAGAMNLTLPGMGALQVRILSGVIYINVSKLGLPGATGKPWMKVDLTDPSNPLGAVFGKISVMNPSQMMSAFTSIATFTKVGIETVDGVQSTHYKVALDTSKAIGMLGLPQSQSGSLPKTIDYDVWVDGMSRPVKIAATNPMVTMEMHFSKWGEPVHVVAPPASQVGEFSF